MRKVLTLLAGAAFVAVLSMPVAASDTTITGEVVDIACAMKKGEGGKGDAHAGCAMACAKKGAPMGIMTADAIYQVAGDYTANNNAKLHEFVAKKVQVVGEVSEKDGTKMITIKTIKMAN